MGGRTSGTWAKGSGIPAGGEGWGGEAKGEGNHEAGPGRPEGMKAGEGKISVADLLVAMGARQTIAANWLAILTDPTHQHHATMLVKAADRVDGLATATSVNVNVDDVSNLSDAELAAELARVRRARAAAAAGDGSAEGGE